MNLMNINHPNDSYWVLGIQKITNRTVVKFELGQAKMALYLSQKCRMKKNNLAKCPIGLCLNKSIN